MNEFMKRLADNIRKANEEAGQVEISSRKISDHFAKIEAVEMQEDSATDISPDLTPDKLQ